MGWTPKYTVAVWVGYPNEFKSMETEFAGQPVAGGTYPASIFHSFIETDLRNNPPKPEETPTPTAPEAGATAVPTTPAPTATAAPDTGGTAPEPTPAPTEAPPAPTAAPPEAATPQPGGDEAPPPED